METQDYRFQFLLYVAYLTLHVHIIFVISTTVAWSKRLHRKTASGDCTSSRSITPEINLLSTYVSVHVSPLYVSLLRRQMRTHLPPTRYALDCTAHLARSHSVRVGQPRTSSHSSLHHSPTTRVTSPSIAPEKSAVCATSSPRVMASATQLRSAAARIAHSSASRETRVPFSAARSSFGHKAERFRLPSFKGSIVIHGANAECFPAAYSRKCCSVVNVTSRSGTMDFLVVQTGGAMRARSE